MNTPDYPHVHATLGDATRAIPTDLAARIEAALHAAHEHAPRGGPSFLTELQRIRDMDAADGQPWPETRLSPGRRMALARADRAASGLTGLLEILHAAERTRLSCDVDQQIGEDVRDALLLACRGLAEHVEEQIRPE